MVFDEGQVNLEAIFWSVHLYVLVSVNLHEEQQTNAVRPTVLPSTKVVVRDTTSTTFSGVVAVKCAGCCDSCDSTISKGKTTAVYICFVSTDGELRSLSVDIEARALVCEKETTTVRC